MNQKTVGLTLRAAIFALALILAAGPGLPLLDGVAYAAHGPKPTLTAVIAPGGASVTVSWNEVADADSYDLRRQLDGSGVWVALTTSGTSHSDPVSGLTAGASYFYIVSAVDDSDSDHRSWSNTVKITIPGGTAAPTGKPTLSASAASLTAANLSWSAVSDATSYDLRRWSGTAWVAIGGTLTGTSYSDTGLTSGSTYYYVIRAVNAGGNGPWSSEGGVGYTTVTLQATTTVPVLTLTHTSREVVDLSWTATSSTATYNLQRGKTTAADATAPPNTGTGAWKNIATGQSGRSYTDNNATYGTVPDGGIAKYYYRVQAVENGLAGNWSKVKMVTIPATGARLPAPASPSASATGASSINFTWNVVAGAVYYQVQYKMGDGDYGNPVRVEPPTASDATTASYAHSGLSASTKYTYQARAVNVNGPSDWSTAASATTSTTSASGQMAKVTGLTLKEATTTTDGTTTRKIELKWSQVSGATHYEISRWATNSWAPTEGGVPAQADNHLAVTALASKSSPKWVDQTGLTAGNTYYYVVRAVEDGPSNLITTTTDNDRGEWSDYRAITLKAIKPAAPTALQTTATSQSTVWVSWVAPATSETAGAASAYELEWRLGTGSASWNRVTVNGTTYNHTGRRAGTEYYYRVRAKNSGGTGLYTAEKAVTTLPTTLSPPSSGLTAADATSGDTITIQVKVSWAAVTGATSYEIQRYNATNGNWTNLEGGENGSVTTVAKATGTVSVTDTNANNAGTTYSYRVRTVNGGSRSLWSAVVSGMTKYSRPATPTLVATTTGKSMIRLSWSGVANATTYTLEFIEGRADTTKFNDPLVGRTAMELAGNLRHYVHTGLKPGTQYSYRLRANLPAGVNTEWDLPENQPYTKPLKPELTATAASATSMTLTWDAVAFVTDANPPVAGRLTTSENYQIERRVSGTSTWTSLTESVTCTNNKCTHTDESLTASTHYYYRIRATVTRGGTAYTSYWDYANQRTPAASQ